MDELVVAVGVLIAIVGIEFYCIRETIEKNNAILIRKIDKIAEIIIGNKYR
jgi:hypothetical protein